MLKRWLGQVLIEDTLFSWEKRGLFDAFFFPVHYSIQSHEYLVMTDFSKFWHCFP